MGFSLSGTKCILLLRNDSSQLFSIIFKSQSALGPDGQAFLWEGDKLYLLFLKKAEGWDWCRSLKRGPGSVSSSAVFMQSRCHFDKSTVTSQSLVPQRRRELRTGGQQAGHPRK